MKYLPIFVKLKNRIVLVVGGGEVALRKIKTLINTSAKIRLISNTLCNELKKIYKNGLISWISYFFDNSMLKNINLIIVATNNLKLNFYIYKNAKKKNILINTVDNKKNCSFIFPSIIDRSPIILAISSSGYSPVFTKILKEKLELFFPSFISSISFLSKNFRKKIKNLIPDINLRRRFWEEIFNNKFINLIKKKKILNAKKFIKKKIKKFKNQKKIGEIILLGAGPGDSGLLTIKGLEVLQQSDIVLYDNLISKDILNMIRKDAKKIFVGKKAGFKSFLQKDINKLIINLAKKGNKVVRLKSGDPFIFSRGGEELKQIYLSGIPVKIIPGITSAIGSAAYSGIPLTYRKYSKILTFISGNYKKEYSDTDWKYFSKNNQTLIIYMGVLKAKIIKNKLIKYGKCPKTPVAIISNGTLNNQKVKIGTLKILNKLIKKTSKPTLFIIGNVVSFYKKMNWFKKKINIYKFKTN